MKWDDIRVRYPNRWLLVEAIVARSEQDKRVVDELIVVSDFEESRTALQNYLEMHRAAPERELYVAHTSRQALDIEERRWAGIRAPA